MIKPEIPHNDKERLEALYSYNVLYTLSEPDYDALVEIASFICDTPIAMISLIDKDKQYFKSMKGVDDRELSRDLSLCAHVINNGPLQMEEIHDTRLDNRFADNPVVTGKPHIIFYAGMPLVTPDGFNLGTLCVIDNKPRQLTDSQKKALASLSIQVVNLLELRKKNNLLTQAQKELELHAGEMKDFAYVASHDLKEPLRMIYQFMNLLSNKYQHSLDDTARKYIHHARDGASRMTSLIENLLVYATAGSRNALPKSVDTTVLLDDIVLLQAAYLEEKKAQVIYTQLPVVQGVDMALRLLFQNLISNAVKFQPANNIPVISIFASDTEDYWQFEVKDNGLGINMLDSTTIFQAFKRLHSIEEYTGTGIGLAICKKIVELHNGKLWVKSEPGAGSSFFFTIKK